MKRVQYIGQLDCVVFEQRGQKSLKNGVVLEVEPGGAVLTSPQKTPDGRIVAFVVPAELAHLIVDVEGGEPETMRHYAVRENERLAKKEARDRLDIGDASVMGTGPVPDVEIDLETGAEKKAAKPKPKPKPEPKPQRMSHPRGRR